MTFKSDSEQDRKADEAGAAPDNSEGNQPFMVVGDRVFQTKDDFVNSWQNAQQHISKLESEAKAREEQAAQAQSEGQKDLARQILDGLQETNRKGDQTDHASNVTLNEDDIAQRVLDKLSAKQTATEREKNMDRCMSAAEEVYGESYKQKVAEKAKELNMDMDKVDNLAKTAPEAFKKLFIPTQQSSGNTSFAAGADQTSATFDSGLRKDEGKTHSIRGKTSTQEKELITELGKELGLY